MSNNECGSFRAVVLSTEWDCMKVLREKRETTEEGCEKRG